MLTPFEGRFLTNDLPQDHFMHGMSLLQSLTPEVLSTVRIKSQLQSMLVLGVVDNRGT